MFSCIIFSSSLDQVSVVVNEYAGSMVYMEGSDVIWGNAAQDGEKGGGA
jgi:hypothetical protein